MTRNSFLFLAGMTIAAAAAAFSVSQLPHVRPSDASGALVFPDLANNLNDLKTIVVRSGDDQLSFDWDGTRWTSRDRDGYPADANKVAMLVVQMAKMEKLEPKTRMPAKYDRLALEDPKTKGSHGKEITLFDSHGKALADLIVGKRKFTLGSKEPGVYVRIPGDPQTWLAQGDLDPGTKPRDWLLREIASVKDMDIKHIVITQPDGGKIVLDKSGPTDTGFTIANLPHGKQAESEYAGNEIGHVLSELMLDDVAKAGTVAFPDDKTTTATFEGFQGLHVEVETTENAGNTWLRIHATASAADNGNKLVGLDWSKVATEINSRSEGWIYQVPAYEVAPLKKHMSDLIKKPDKGTKS